MLWRVSIDLIPSLLNTIPGDYVDLILFSIELTLSSKDY